MAFLNRIDLGQMFYHLIIFEFQVIKIQIIDSIRIIQGGFDKLTYIEKIKKLFLLAGGRIVFILAKQELPAFLMP